MRVNPYSGRFVVLEGLDGSGKTTQAKLLAGFLNERTSREVVLTEEPTAGEWGRVIRYVLNHYGLRPDGRRVVDSELQEFFIRDRGEHRLWEAEILAAGNTVLSDRDFLSTIAYGLAAGVEPDILLAKHDEIIGEMFFAPNVFIVVDVSPEVAFERLRKGREAQDYFEKLEKLSRIREAYLTLARDLVFRYPFLDIRVVDGEGDQDVVLERLRQSLR